MAFTEESQTFLIAAYYRELKETFGSRGVAAFVHAVKQYGIQRGNRMAQRAIRDGQPLDYVTFCRYGEWEHSHEILQAGKGSKTEIVQLSPDYKLHVLSCPWYQAFEKYGALEAGALYCANLDEAINQGFNGEIPFRTVQTKHTAEFCIFHVRDAGIIAQTDLSHHPGVVRGFDYHSAHVFAAFGGVCRGVFGEDEGRALMKRVLDAFGCEFGSQMAEELAGMSDQDFLTA